ncbi:MAG TPA: ornithine--oxo-acid transaminase [Zeimonas sp.]|nr:ornithine--oxo-acid transaminase [Zeimonas sp.]
MNGTTHNVDPATRAAIERERAVCAQNYAPLPVVIERGDDVWLYDLAGRRYLDFMSAYSAVAHGHRHPRLVAAARAQLARICVTSRAFHNDRLGPFLAELCRLSGFERALPMNTGAEAVETAIKAVRRWGYRVKGIAPGRATILVARGNFHGRTTTIVGFSSDPDTRRDFEPFASGFRLFDFGDLASLNAVGGDDVCAVLVEPIQGEAGVVVPPDGWLRSVREWCDRHRVLLVLDEIQSGLGRTGRNFAFEHESIRPDAIVVGKALGGGIVPVSAFVADAALMDVFEPGSHGSTFGGNPLAAAVGLEALRVLQEEQLAQRSAVLGRHLLERLRAIADARRIEVRGRGLWAGLDLHDCGLDAHEFVERLAHRGVLTKEAHDAVRIAPALTITRAQLDWGLERIAEVLDEMAPSSSGATRGRGGARRPAPKDGRRSAARGAPPHLLMCPPDHFEVRYRINPWMHPEAWSLDAARLAHEARIGWHALHDAYRRLGARIETISPQPGSPDLVFTANGAVVLDGRVLLARFRNPERRAEEAHVRRAFESLLARGLVESLHAVDDGVYFEGAGDALWDAKRQVMWMGYGQRSDREAREAVRRVFGVETLSLELASPSFYHLDTCLCVLSHGEILWYPPAFPEASQRLVRAIAGPDAIEASDEDATRFAVNAVCLGDELLACHASPRLRDTLAERCYRVRVVPLEPFNRSGGAACCLTLRLDLRSAAAKRARRAHAA